MRKTIIISAIAAAVGALVATPVAVYASHHFSDVPDSHTFHNSIDWMRANNITVGCNPPANDRYCPSDPVNRGQMSAFMKRLAENQVVDAAALEGSTAGQLVPRITSGWNNIPPDFDDPPPTLASATIDAPTSGTLLIEYAVEVGSILGEGTAWVEPGTSNCSFGGDRIGPEADVSQQDQSYLRWFDTEIDSGTHSYQVCGIIDSGGFTVEAEGSGISLTFAPDGG